MGVLLFDQLSAIIATSLPTSCPSSPHLYCHVHYQMLNVRWTVLSPQIQIAGICLYENIVYLNYLDN